MILVEEDVVTSRSSFALISRASVDVGSLASGKYRRSPAFATGFAPPTRFTDRFFGRGAARLVSSLRFASRRRWRSSKCDVILTEGYLYLRLRARAHVALRSFLRSPLATAWKPFWMADTDREAPHAWQTQLLRRVLGSFTSAVSEDLHIWQMT